MTDAVQDGKETQAVLAELVMTDPLTGLSNTRHFEQSVRRMLTTGVFRFAVLTLDLDRFKAVNDTLGHPLGDQLLRKVSDRLRVALGPDGLVARLGGDEFATLCLLGKDRSGAERTASKIIELLSRPFLIDGHQVNIGVSVGIAVAEGGDLGYEMLMKHADLALYAAKEAGRGRSCLFHQSLADQAQARRKMELDLRKALPLRQMEVHYRPRVDVDTGELVGLQAVLFWRRPQHGLLPASEFLPLAAQIGLVPKLGKWLLDVACREAAGLPQGFRISVAVTTAQFAEGSALVDAVRQALTTSKLAASSLEIEITEHLLLTHEQATVSALHALRAFGVRIVMNDFGVGYASLTKLTSFPFDGIKIASFFATQSEMPSNRAIVHAVATLGASLGVTTQIDGIYSKDHMKQLRLDGKAPVQGCRVEAALPSAELKAFLQLPNRTPTLQEVS